MAVERTKKSKQRTYFVMKQVCHVPSNSNATIHLLVESSEEEDFQSTRSHSESHSSFDDDQVLFPRTKNVFVRLLKIFGE